MRMNIKKSSVAIIGCGLVGSSTAFCLVTQGVCDEIIMIDLSPERALGEVMDLNDTISYLDRNVKVKVGKYSDCKDVDIVVITAGAPPKPGQTRLDMTEISASIMRSIVPEVMASGFDGVFIVVSNPVDIMAYLVYQLSGLPKNQVIGTGTSIDTARLTNFIAERIGIDPRNVQAYAMGEHGDSLMVPWSSVTIAGKAFHDVIQDNPDMLHDLDLQDLVYQTTREGWEIYNRKGTTYYGVASACVRIIKCVLYDENRIIPVSALLEGEYGETDVYAGVPCILNKSGASDILEIHMNEEEQEAFKKSTDQMREYIQRIS